ncbi:MAG: hypothetical protein ACREMK_02165 [Gemmatimonadota bacterium]
MRVAPILNVAAKLLLVALLLFAVANPDMPRFAGKAMGIRSVLYPLATLLIPLVWILKGRPRPYPHAADTLLAGPFLVDVGGNVANLYDTVVWFDDAAHALTWMLLVFAVGALLLRLRLAPWITAALCIGFGSVTHVLWEILEYLIMISGRTGLHLTYGDTVGDLAASLSGSVLAGLVTGWIAAKLSSGSPRTPR